MPGRSPGVWVFAPTIAMSFRDAGFTPAQAWPWWRRGLNAALAEKWRDAGASGTVAERWINGGFDDSDVAASWIGQARPRPRRPCSCGRARTPTKALEWRDNGFDAASITGWVRAGFTADDAPDLAARWIQPAEARDWRAAGFSAVDAFMWRAQQ